MGEDGRDVPGDLAVGLHEVGVAVGRRVEGVERGRLERRRPPAPRGRAAPGRRPRGRAGRSAGSGTAAPSSSWRRDRTAGRWGSPAPTTISGAPCCDSSWQAAQIAETSSGCTSCISSMNRAMPLPRSAATPGGVAEQLDQVDLHVAGVGPAGGGGHVDAGLPAVADLGVGRLPQGEGLEDAEHLLDRLLVPVPWARARAAPCAARRRPAGAATARAGPRSCRCPSRGRSPPSAAG